MAKRPIARSFLAGVLAANSLPHLATALTGHRHLTPLRGRESSPRVNLLWGCANAVAGAVLLRSAQDRAGDGRWDARLVAFDAGAAAFATWMTVSEATMKMNWTPES